MMRSPERPQGAIVQPSFLRMFDPLWPPTPAASEEGSPHFWLERGSLQADAAPFAAALGAATLAEAPFAWPPTRLQLEDSEWLGLHAVPPTSATAPRSLVLHLGAAVLLRPDPTGWARWQPGHVAGLRLLLHAVQPPWADADGLPPGSLGRLRAAGWHHPAWPGPQRTVPLPLTGPWLTPAPQRLTLQPAHGDEVTLHFEQLALAWPAASCWQASLAC